MKRIALLPLLLAACATVPPQTDGIARARLGQTVYVDGPRVTPLKVLSDSRCPMEARCVWAGTVELAVRIKLGSRTQLATLKLGEPFPVADGTLELTDVMPPRSTQRAIKPRDYRFGLRFAGGL